MALPRTWTRPLISLVQPIIPFQDGIQSASDAVTGQSGQPVVTNAFGNSEADPRLQSAYEHQVVSLSARVAELEDEVGRLAATRSWEVTGRRLGMKGTLQAARIVAGDILPWRDSRLVTQGAVHGVKTGAAVASALFTINRGSSVGMRSGLAVLESEVFIGDVDQVGTHSARVRLVTDIGNEVKVRIARRTNERIIPIDRFFWMVGRGRGVAHVTDLERREVESGLVQAGDWVLTDGESSALPMSMVIGRIESLEPDHDNPLLSYAVLQSAVDMAGLRKVYIFDPGGETETPARPD